MTPSPVEQSTLDALTQINLDDFFESLGIARMPQGRLLKLLRLLFWPPARRFAHLVAEFDARVGQAGLAAGSAWLLQRMTHSLEVAGRANVPAAGPAFILANHPGMTDTIALFACLPRQDLRVIAQARPFLKNLPHVTRQMIYVPDSAAERMGAVRLAASHLRQGGLTLTFPAGEIEPDPAVHGAHEATASLDKWSDSIALFARLAPQTQIVPAIVSGVVSAGALHNPLTRLRSTRHDQERMAAALQIMIPAYHAVRVRVAFGPPLLAAELLAAHRDSAALTHAITEQARHLIENPPTRWEMMPINEPPSRTLVF